MIFFFDDTSKINKTSLLHVNSSMCFVICPEGLRSTLDSIFDGTVEIHGTIHASGGYEKCTYCSHNDTFCEQKGRLAGRTFPGFWENKKRQLAVPGLMVLR